MRLLTAGTIFKIGLLGGAVIFSGCASIVNGRSEDVTINTIPSGADCFVGDVKSRTPAKISLKRNSNYRVRCEKDGHNSGDAQIKSQTSGWVWGNLASWGVAGLILDFTTGAAYKLRPNELNIGLFPLPQPIIPPAMPLSAEGGSAAKISYEAPKSDGLPIATGKSRTHAYAVVIGVEHYRESLPAAKYALNDANTTAEYVKRFLGYKDENVAVLTDARASKSDFEKYFEKWLPNRVESGDEVFIYFSGHGAPNVKNGDAYMVPYDGDPTYIEQTGYSLKRLYGNLAKLPAKRIVVAMDSCFSGAGGRSVLASGARPLVSMQVVNVPPRLTVITASDSNQISYSYSGKDHGLFTYFLLKGLNDNNGDLRAAYDYLRPQVSRVARLDYNADQIPQWIEGR